MVVFNKLQKKQLQVYLDNRDKFTNDELKSIFTNFITFKLDGDKYSEATINQKLTTLNKILVKDYDLTILSVESNKVVEDWRKDRVENPIKEKKEDEKIDISADDIRHLKTPIVNFLSNPANKTIYQDSSKRAKRNELLDLINGVYAFLLLNSGCRLAELLQMSFNESGKDKIIHKVVKSINKTREFVPLFISSKDWLHLLKQVRDIVGLETTSAVNKRLNEYLKKTYETISKSHTIRKIYSSLVKDSNNNPLSHSDPDMLHVYNAIKYDKPDDMEELKEDVKVNTTSDKRKCDVCSKLVSKKNWTRHLKSKSHLKNN